MDDDINVLLDPFDEDLDDYYLAVKCHMMATLSAKISFLPNKGCGFTKDNISHVCHLCECFKMLKVVQCLNISTMQDILAAAPEFLDCNMAILMAMQGLL